MEVDVKHRLASFAVAVEEGAVPSVGVALLLRNGGCTPDHFADERIVSRGKVVERRDVTSRDDENMERSLRVEILKGHEPIILIDDRRRNLPGRNSTE